MAIHQYFSRLRRLPPPLQTIAARLSNTLLQILLALRIDKTPRVSISAKDVIVAGYFHSVLGIGSSARLLAAALQAIGYTVHRLDFSGSFVKQDWGLPPPKPRQFLAACPAQAPIIFVMNPPHLRQVLLLLGKNLLRRPRIGLFAWELPGPPLGWASLYPYLSEVWGISTFTSKALSTTAVQVKTVPNPLFTQAVGSSQRAAFDLPTDKIIILCAFDTRSSLARKNALGNLEAFQRAFTPDDDRVLLLLKTVNAETAAAAVRALGKKLTGWSNIRFMDRKLTDAAMLDLIAGADIYLSLHRAEGFGLMLAESMRAGKVVVATGWSGNLDFMNEENSCLVPYRLIPVYDPQGIYRQPQQHWAEPDTEAAATILRQLIEDIDLRLRLGKAAASSQNASVSQDMFVERIATTCLGTAN